MKDHSELFEALLSGQELVSVHSGDILKLVDGWMVLFNRRYQYVNPKDWEIRVNNNLPEE